MPQWEIILQGRVQGVGFRYFAKKQALRLGLRGCVRNLPDGSVCIVVDADDRDLELYCELLRRGTFFSRVDTLSTELIDKPKEYNDFEIL
ncbi:MAG: acylphosphatase [Candidatus Cloacimonetes bacterium]|jgi:acylphosphatase|nr:acylphosphatase [Candidatus Cloacimonadota bacterium]MCK9177916.1 acylphosphatase [Candidatus Cloacimonadota bacterium]MDD3103204.1 acylphosphatase [Candidatus Cloacimonadota bacterium]MDD3533633.1 acylphosphatase [Candidatus Cloacimonadota bacterium]